MRLLTILTLIILTACASADDKPFARDVLDAAVEKDVKQFLAHLYSDTVFTMADYDYYFGHHADYESDGVVYTFCSKEDQALNKRDRRKHYENGISDDCIGLLRLHNTDDPQRQSYYIADLRKILSKKSQWEVKRVWTSYLRDTFHLSTGASVYYKLGIFDGERYLILEMPKDDGLKELLGRVTIKSIDSWQYYEHPDAWRSSP